MRSSPSGPNSAISVGTSYAAAALIRSSAACCGVAKLFRLCAAGWLVVFVCAIAVTDTKQSQTIMRVVGAFRLNILDVISSSSHYLLLPPPERPPPPREPPILEAPRELLARACPPLERAEAPPNALRFVALGPWDTCRLPTRSPPPPRFISLVPALGPAPRF